MAVNRTEHLMTILHNLSGMTADIEASAVVSSDGLVIASALPQDIEEDRVAAMSAAMLSLGERTSFELGRGALEQVFIRGEKGFVILMDAGQDSVLTAMVRSEAKLGLVFLEMKRAAAEIGKLV
jgi:uncharacterized protein